MIIPDKIYILVGNPFIYEAYDNFCEKLSYKLEPIIVKYSSNPENHFTELDSYFYNESQLEKTILFAHSYGCYHAIKINEKYTFHSCYLLGPFLMKPSENILGYLQTEFVLELFSLTLFRNIIFFIFHFIILFTTDFMFNYIFGIKKPDISNTRAISILDTTRWEKREIAYINDLSYLQNYKKLKNIHLLRPINDLWSNYKIFKYWNPKNKRLLNIQHAFCLNDKDCEIVCKTIFDDIEDFTIKS